MSLTKKEKAEIAELQVLAALRWSDPVPRDIPAPKDGDTNGFDFNAYSADVWPAWSSTVCHGRGTRADGRSRSQNARALFSTEVLALKAMRHEMCKGFAEKLAAVDRRIAALASAEGAK